MIIGSGLLARAFAQYRQHSDVCIYAAGVSNSSSTDSCEFARDRARLVAALQSVNDVSAFVYFGTCSVADPVSWHTPYVQHKLAMEQLVAEHPHHLILRLPQVAGHTPNPHTLLNFLYARIVRSEVFSVWCNAYRNIIDIDDVATLANLLIENLTMRHCTLNIANPCSYSMPEIVNEMERVVGKKAIFNMVESGVYYEIEVTTMLPVLAKTQIIFDEHYLNRVLRKYYEKF
jgi:nucleoside-diphosphate-sugar epimerase